MLLQQAHFHKFYWWNSKYNWVQVFVIWVHRWEVEFFFFVSFLAVRGEGWQNHIFRNHGSKSLFLMIKKIAFIGENHSYLMVCTEADGKLDLDFRLGLAHRLRCADPCLKWIRKQKSHESHERFSLQLILSHEVRSTAVIVYGHS